jgi:signal transduction histidine kinase/CheY-like chemotaxis protein
MARIRRIVVEPDLPSKPGHKSGRHSAETNVDSPFDSEHPEDLTLPAIRRKVLDRMLLTMVLLGGFVIGITAVLDFMRGNYFTGSLYVAFFALLVGTLLIKTIPYAIRCAFVLFLIYFLATYEIFNWGIGTIGPVLYVTLIMFSSILVGTRAAAGTILVCLASLISLSIYHWSILPPEDTRSAWQYVQSQWLPDIMNMAMVATMLTAFMELLLRGLQKSVQRTQEHVEELRSERNHLAETIKERDAAESQLIRAQKMEAVGQLAGGIAHDFNNLLQVVLGYGETSMMDVEPDTELYDNLDQITKAGERGKKLVRQLLAFSRRQVLELSDIQLNNVISEMDEILKLLLGEHVSIEFKPDHQLGTVRADRGQIEQVIVNLCVNARDAMPDGGTLTIETLGKESDDPAIRAEVAMVRVSDTGTGMSSETQEQIFEPFFSTKGPEEGTGLGLSTVFGIVHQHDGTIQCDSEPGNGATFTVTLPTVEAVTEERQEPLETIVVTPPEPGEQTILLADDEPMVLRISTAMLESAGYQVLTATDGIEAINVLDQHGGRIGIAVLDVVMPRLGGKGVADHIKKNRLPIPVLFASGYSSDTVKSHFVPNQETHFIQKPFRRDELLQKVAEVIQHQH